MTRKHFRQLAEALRITEASPKTVKQIALVCARNNPNFDWDKFREACNSCYLANEHYREAVND
tara:strand:- start:283 stop:471 length:189 start_codon:yes stop_codon:yes gene_type:complete